MSVRGLIVGLALALLAACTLPGNREADAAARGLYEAMRAGNDLSSDNQLAETLRTPQALEALAEARAMIPREAPQSVESRSWRYSVVNGTNEADLTHAYRYADRTVIAETVLRKPAGSHSWLIVDFRVRLEDAAPEQQLTRPDPRLNPQRT